MSAYNDIDSSAASSITAIDSAVTKAISAANDFMPTIRELAKLRAPYSLPADAKYNKTTFDQSEVTTPAFTELENADDAVEEAAAQNLGDLSTTAGAIHPELKGNLDPVNTDFERIWTDLQAEALKPREVAFKEDDFVADIIKDVQDKLVSALGDQPRSSTARESAYYANDARRRSAARQKELNDTLNEFAGCGFKLPADILADMGSFILTKQGMDEADRARTVILQQSTMSDENKWKAIEGGLRYDQILLMYFDRKMQRAFQIAMALFKVAQDMAALKFYVLTGRMEMQDDYFNLVSENQRLVFSEFEQNAKGFETRMDALIAEAGQYLDSFQAEGQVYGIRQKALGDERRFIQSENEISVETLLWNLQNGIKAFLQNVSAFESTAKMRMEAASAGSSIQMGIASAAKNSMTAVIGIMAEESVVQVQE